MSNTTNEQRSVAHAKFILNALSHLENGKVNWTRVASDNGFGYARNACAKFNSIVKQYGYKYEDGKVVSVGDEGASGSTAPATPKTPRTKKTIKDGDVGGSTTPASKSSNKKRKIVQSAGDDLADFAFSGDDQD